MSAQDGAGRPLEHATRHAVHIDGGGAVAHERNAEVARKAPKRGFSSTMSVGSILRSLWKAAGNEPLAIMPSRTRGTISRMTPTFEPSGRFPDEHFLEVDVDQRACSSSAPPASPIIETRASKMCGRW